MNGYANDHGIADHLPAFVNGTLSAGPMERVRAHLVGCARCRRELADWEAIAHATEMVVSRAAAPSATPRRLPVAFDVAGAPSSGQASGTIPLPHGKRSPARWGSGGRLAAAILVLVLLGGSIIAGTFGRDGLGGEGEDRRLAAIQGSPPSSPEASVPSACDVTPRQALTGDFADRYVPGPGVILEPEQEGSGAARIVVAEGFGTPVVGRIRVDDSYVILEEHGDPDRVVTIEEVGPRVTILPPAGTPTATVVRGIPGRLRVPETQLPTGQPASDDAIAAITATMRNLDACGHIQEGEDYDTVARRAFALYSDDYFRRFASAPEEIGNWTPHHLGDLVLRDARTLPDGRMGAILDYPGGQDTFLIFVRSGDRYLIDEFVNITAESTGTPTP